MSNLFKAAGDRIRGSPGVIVVWLATLAFTIVCAALLWEAYTTSVLGYEMIPTEKANSWVIPLVGLLPILGQIVFSYAFISDTRKGWAGLIVFGLHAVDMATDVIYKVHGRMDFGLIVVALIESEVLYTVGAIMGFTFAMGMLLQLTPDAIHEFGTLARSTLHGLGVTEKEPKGGGSGNGQGAPNDPLANMGGRRNP